MRINSEKATDCPQGCSDRRVVGKTEKILIDIRELSAMTGLQRGSLYHLVSQHRIPFVRISSRCIRFELNAIREWIATLSMPADHAKVKGAKR